mmetsp:Transcript_19308/g.19009  ORF Transcript_19308/g.19009 Transcript_19308/m.19009 type:complete len:80 (+) Transcript_19308:400-639(+)
MVNAKVTNGNFYVKGGGGWYTLKDYIHEFFVKKKASKRNSIRKRVLTSEIGGKDGEKNSPQKEIISLNSSIRSSTKKNE